MWVLFGLVWLLLCWLWLCCRCCISVWKSGLYELNIEGFKEKASVSAGQP